MTNLSFTDQRGQAITEFAIFLPIYLLLIFGLIFFAKAYFIQQQTISAARYAAWQKGDFNTADDEITNNIKKFFFRTLDDSRVTVEPVSASQTYNSQIQHGQSQSGETGGDTTGYMGSLMNGLMGVMDSLSSTRGYHVAYDLPVLPYLAGFLGNATKIGATCHVDKNCWTYKDVGSFWNALWELIKSLVGGIADIFG